MSKEIALITPNQLIDEGIKHQLTQGDLLEIVADNRISEINRQLNIFNKRADVIRENIRYKNVFSSFIDTFKFAMVFNHYPVTKNKGYEILMFAR